MGQRMVASGAGGGGVGGTQRAAVGLVNRRYGGR
jgi:hypothetical protein